MQHSALLSTSLPATLQKPALMQRPNLLQQLLDMLPAKFSYTEFMDAVERQGTPPTTGKRWLKKCVALKLLLKEENSYRKP